MTVDYLGEHSPEIEDDRTRKKRKKRKKRRKANIVCGDTVEGADTAVSRLKEGGIKKVS